MKKIAFIVHGGASELTPFIASHIEEQREGLKEAVSRGYQILACGGSALDAVEAGVKSLEDNYLFNAGRGSALNEKGKVEMDAAIMDGKTLAAGGVSIVRRVQNPIVLARIVMTKTKHVLLAGYGALELAKASEIHLKNVNYFVTEHQYHNFLAYSKEIAENKKKSGTVGAVALDQYGNIASATSTGGTSYCLPGRIGDSCIIGAGCYANNKTCAVSGTGEGEVLIRGVVAHTIAMLVELKKWPLQKACTEVIKKRNKQGDIGVIALNRQGELGIAFNTEVMKRAWMTSDMKKIIVKIH